MDTTIHDQGCVQAYDIEYSENEFMNASFSEAEHNYQSHIY